MYSFSPRISFLVMSPHLKRWLIKIPLSPTHFPVSGSNTAYLVSWFLRLDLWQYSNPLDPRLLLVLWRQIVLLFKVLLESPKIGVYTLTIINTTGELKISLMGMYTANVLPYQLH